MKELIKQNYEVTRKRGLITDKTTIVEFYDKIAEEINELFYTFANKDNTLKPIYIKDEFNNELADIILVCMNLFYHNGHSYYDIKNILEKKIEINRKRI